MAASSSPFLTAQWRHLAIVSYVASPAALKLWLPRGTELDDWRPGEPLVSLVGFLFRDTRVLGLAIPFHRQFEEINLRFYVRRKTDAGWRRGVVFIRELAPRRAVVWTAKLVYGERYLAVPMAHRIDYSRIGHCAMSGASYTWRFRGEDYRLSASTRCAPALPAADSEAALIVNQSFGYCGSPQRATLEYQVDHPPWTVQPADTTQVAGDMRALYGPELGEILAAAPVSSLLADGSPVAVFRGWQLD